MESDISSDSAFTASSLSFKDTKKLFPFSRTVSSWCGISVIPAFSSASHTSVEESTIVGTPIATTGIPIVSRLIAPRRFPIPDPGDIPVSQSCTVVPSLSMLRAASASIAIITYGEILCTSDFMRSDVSIPV